MTTSHEIESKLICGHRLLGVCSNDLCAPTMTPKDGTIGKQTGKKVFSAILRVDYSPEGGSKACRRGG